MNDPTDEPLLNGLDRLPADAFDSPITEHGRREDIFRRTAGVIRRYRWQRRARNAGVLVLVFLAGAWAGSALLGGGTSPTFPESGPGKAVAAPDFAPAELEKQGDFRQAGDRYLVASRPDPVAAARCYRQLIEESDSPVAQADDSWLLLYMKLDRPQEK